MNRVHRTILTPLLIGLSGAMVAAQELEPAETAVRGVNPADNLTKFEILPKVTMIDDSSDTSIWTTTLKYDRAFQGIYGLNVEMPLAAFDSPGVEEAGLGDLNLRGRVQRQIGRWTFIAGAEAVLPTATDDTLGSGKFQLNPTVVAVYSFSAQTFIVAAAKHLFSLAGESDRADIAQGQYRIILAHTTASGWWFLADPQLWIDYGNEQRLHFAPELEIGKMVGTQTGVWLRGGGHLGGDWEKDDWSISAGIRFIFF
jgi:hypothetical protein